MCIIICKPAEKNLPDTETLKNCFMFNPDGAGFAYNTKDGIYISKGYMVYSEFLSALNAVENPKDKNMIIHTRITTHGDTIGGNTHPFPVSDNFRVLQALEYTSDLVVAHNGIISSVTVPAKSGLSDTQIYIRDVLYPLKQAVGNEFYKDENCQNLIIATMGASKFSFLDSSGITTIGDFNEFDGCQYSNYSYLRTNYVTSYGAYKTSDYKSGAWYDQYDDNYYDTYGASYSTSNKKSNGCSFCTVKNNDDCDQRAIKFLEDENIEVVIDNEVFSPYEFAIDRYNMIYWYDQEHLYGYRLDHASHARTVDKKKRLYWNAFDGVKITNICILKG